MKKHQTENDIQPVVKTGSGPAFYFISLFITLSLFFQFVFEPKLFYHQFQTLFLTNRYFFYEFSAYPGGLAEWISLFIFQFFYFEWAGSLIFAALLSAIHYVLYLCGRRFVPAWTALLFSVFPVSLLFGLQLNYNFPFYFIFKTLFLVLLFYLFISVKKKTKILYLCLLPLFYYFLGGYYFLLLSLFILVHELVFSKGKAKYLFAGSYLIIYLLLPYLAARYWFIITLSDAYLYSIPYAYYFDPFSFAPSPLFYLFSFAVVFTIHAVYAAGKFFHDRPGLITDRIPSRYKTILSIFVSLLLFASLFYLNFNGTSRSKLRIAYYADQQKWVKVIREVKNIKEYDRLVYFHVNRALGHTGGLLDRLFDFNQKAGADGLFVTKYIASQIAIPASDLHFDFGHINASRVFAYEGFTKYKYHPKILKRLALTNIIQGNMLAAKKFIIRLRNSLIYKDWACNYEKYIADPSLIKSEPLLYRKSLYTPKEDFFINRHFPGIDMLELIKANKSNKLALDYLFASFLLEGSLTNLFKYIHLFKEAGITNLPRHVKEAILVHAMIRKMDPRILVERFSIDRTMVNEFLEFSRIVKQNHNNKKLAQQLTKKDFRTTYWYYLHFIHPNITGLKIKSQVKDVYMYKF